MREPRRIPSETRITLRGSSPITFQAVCLITHRLTRITYHIYSLLKILQGFPDQVFPDRYFPIRYFPIEGVIVPS